MSEEKSSYRQIMKATSLFGGVQLFQIIIQVIRSKFIALLLGPEGMGISGLLYSTTNFISGLTNFGLVTSSVKNISEANSTGDQFKISTVITVLRKLVWITGTLGTILTLVLSPWLSQLTFGNRSYTLAFVLISITLLFNQLTNGQMALLQGLRKLQYLAKANLSGSSLGLLIVIPLYYKWGIDAIVPVIIITSVVSLTLSFFFSNKVKIESVSITREIAVIEGKKMLSLGFMINLSMLFAIGSSHIVRIFINRTGGIEQIGLYNAGFTIINTYVGLVLNAMATDYYPRLSAVAQNNKLCLQTINQQAEIVLLILAPILIIFLIFIKWVIILLYSVKFTSVSDMMYWAALGMFFKASSWAIAFIFLAKGSSKIFFWNELVANILMLILNIIGYHLGGLTGLGISFAVLYLIYLLQVYLVTRIKFQFAFDSSFLKIFIIQFGLAVSAFITVGYIAKPYCYIIGILLITISSWYTVIELEKRLKLFGIIKKWLQRS